MCKRQRDTGGMNTDSAGWCRDRALYWLTHADETAVGFEEKKLMLEPLERVWSIVGSRAALAQAWAMLAMSAPLP